MKFKAHFAIARNGRADCDKFFYRWVYQAVFIRRHSGKSPLVIVYFKNSRPFAAIVSTAPRRPACSIAIAGPFVGITVTQESVDHGCGTTHTEIAGYRVKRAVFRTGAAFKASVFIIDKRLLIFNGNYVARTDIDAHAASRAFVMAYGNGGHIV
jgi:hypothetical protein